MIRTDIKEIFVNIADKKDVRAILPFSVSSLIDEEILDESCARESYATFNAYVTLDTPPSEGEYVFLRLHALYGGYEVFYNGEKREDVNSYREQVTYDVTDAAREGVNTIEIRVSCDNMLDAGVFDSIEIIRTSYAIIDKVTVDQIHEEDKVTLNIDLGAMGAVDNVRAVATLISGSGQIYYGGITKGHGTITVQSPLYWWPVGLGVQNLYRLSISIYGDMEVEDSYEVRVGLRTLSTAKAMDGSVLVANGTSFVPMGILYDTPKRRYVKEMEDLIEADLAAAAKVGANTVVIPAHADMPREYFFELCDLYGIVAIRETTDVAYDSDALARASKYASCGIVDVVCTEDKIESMADTLHGINPDFDIACEDKAASYPSIKSLAAYKTICDKLFQSDRNVFSRRVEAAAEGDMINILSACAEHFLYASNIYDIAYISQLTEAYRAEAAVMDARINRDNGKRAVFGSLGKKRDVVGDGPIDCNKRAKAVSYRAAKFFAPTVVYATLEGTCAHIYISNETRNDFAGMLVCKIINSKNDIIHVEQRDCTCDKSSSTLVCMRDFAEYVSGHEHEYYLEYELKDGALVVSKGVSLFVPEKRFVYENPNIKAEIIGADRKFSITLTAEAFAQGVEIDFIGHNAVFFDNFIDITSNMPMKLSFGVIGSLTTAEKLKSELRIKSVYDIGKSYI